MEQQSEQTPEATPWAPGTLQHLLTDPLDEQVELFQGALFLAIEFANRSRADIALSVDAAHRDQIYKALNPEAAEVLEADGELVVEETGQSIRFVDDGDLGKFVGLIFFVDASPARLALLKKIKTAIAVVVPSNAAQKADAESEFPYIGHAILRTEPALTLSDSQRERLDWLDARYNRVSDHQFSPQSSVVELGAGEPQVCRYCDKTAPEVTFTNKSHAFPELIGNKKLIDLRECDVCNELFSRLLEDQFGKWSLPRRSTGRIKGKKKAPSYRSSDEKFRIDVKGKELKISHPAGDPRVVVDHDSKIVEMQLERQPYVPMGVFKTLVKMALAVMPDTLLAECEHLKRWILEPEHTFGSFPYKPLMLFDQLLPGPLPNDRVSYILLRRKPGVTDCPYMMFLVAYGNHVHQIILPMPLRDTIEGHGTLNVRYFPTPVETDDYVKEFGQPRRTQVDLSSPDVVKGEISPIHFSFEKGSEVPRAPST